MHKMNWLSWTAIILLIIGGLNWGLIGLFKFDLVYFLLGSGLIADIVYILVGLAALYKIYLLASK